jgi:hypothetical protein
MFITQPARDEVTVVIPNSSLVLFAPACASPLALALTLSLTPLAGSLVGSTCLSAGILSTASLGIASGRDAGSAISTRRGLSTGGSFSSSSCACLGGSAGPSGCALSSSTCRSRARAVQLALDESEGVLAVLGTVALVGGLVAAVAAVRVGAVAVGLHVGAGLLWDSMLARFDLVRSLLVFSVGENPCTRTDTRRMETKGKLTAQV